MKFFNIIIVKDFFRNFVGISQQVLGYGSIKTTEIYTYITNKGLYKIDNPLDNIE